MSSEITTDIFTGTKSRKPSKIRRSQAISSTDIKYFFQKNRKKFRFSAEFFKNGKILSRKRPQAPKKWAFAGFSEHKKSRKFKRQINFNEI